MGRLADAPTQRVSSRLGVSAHLKEVKEAKEVTSKTASSLLTEVTLKSVKSLTRQSSSQSEFWPSDAELSNIAASNPVLNEPGLLSSQESHQDRQHFGSFREGGREYAMVRPAKSSSQIYLYEDISRDKDAQDGDCDGDCAG